MRLVAWNANHNGKRRSFDENLRLLAPLNGDILVLSETAGPPAGHPLGAHWIGPGAPGLAVVAPNGLTLTPHPLNNGAPSLMGAFHVNGRIAFDLLAAWPVQGMRGPTYHQILMAGLDRYADFLRSTRTILVGDLNSSSRVSRQRTTHPRFVQRAESLGLVSAYHVLTGEPHGEETIATYRHSTGPTREFHLDYCFVGQPICGSATLRILNDADWAGRSDHFPLVLDLRDELLGPPLE